MTQSDTHQQPAENEHYEIRQMTRQELGFAVDLAAKEGWNPGLYDADCFYAVDPNGFFIGLLDGEPISCISAVKYPNNYGFIGFYIVKDGYRGQGYGYKIWQHGIAYLQDYDIGLDGVLAQVDNYAKSHFILSHQNARYEGRAIGNGSLNHARIVNLLDSPIERVATYDETIFLSNRRTFLELWISRPETIAIGITDAHNPQVLTGYGVARPCRKGYKIGALFADNANDADLLFTELLARLPKATAIYLDIPSQDKNPEALALAQKHHMQAVFATARMYRLNNPDQKKELPLEKWFGVTTFELG